MSKHFPTFSRFWPVLGQLPRWLSTPWWAADLLASKQNALLRVLSVAIAEHLEVAPLVISLASEHRGRYRRRLFRLARRLGSGTPLTSALEQTPGVLSEEQILAIRLGAQSGTLAQTLQSMVDESERPYHQIGYRLRQIGFYAAFVGVLFLLVLTYLLIQVIPSFRAILADFELDLTKPLELLIGLSHLVVSLSFLLLLLVAFGLWVVKSERSRKFFRRRVLSRVLKPIARLRSADLLNLLATVSREGRPLPGAISTLARYHYDSLIRHKLLFVRNEVEQGAELWSSMAQARLISPLEARALTSSVAAGCQTWTIRHLARRKRDHVARRLDTYLDILLPVVILLMAAVVMLTALATLTPLIHLIDSVG